VLLLRHVCEWSSNGTMFHQTLILHHILHVNERANKRTSNVSTAQGETVICGTPIIYICKGSEKVKDYRSHVLSHDQSALFTAYLFLVQERDF